MLSRSRAIFVLLPLLGFFLAATQFAGPRSLPLSSSAKREEVTQSPAAPAPSDTPSETVYVIALGKDGRPITDLKAEEVHIFENKVEQKPTSVSLASDEPMTIGLFFDISGSRRADRSINEEAKLVREFVHAIWREGDTGFVLGFSSQVFAATRPTHSLEDIDNGLSKIPDATYYGPTALYDALCAVKADKLNGISGRKVYVALSDFDDNSSGNRLENVVELARAAKIGIFPVILSEGFGGGYSKRAEKRGRQTAQEIAGQSGGEVLIPGSHKDLKPVFERLANDVRATYRITYSPSAAPSDDHRKKLRNETTRPHVKLLFAKD